MSQRKSFPISLAVLVVAILVAARGAHADEQSDLDKGRAAYQARRFGEAENRFRAMLEPTTGSARDPGVISQVRMYVGAILVGTSKSPEAVSLFEKLLLDDPEFEPDPLLFPTDVINVFIDTRAKIRDRLNAAARDSARRAAERKAKEDDDRRRHAARMEMLESLAKEEKIVIRHSRIVASMPFGIGQFQNGHKTLGWFFLSSEALFAASAAVTLPIYLVNLKSAADAYNPGTNTSLAQMYLDRANEIRNINLVLNASFAATALIGIVDAHARYVPDVVEVKTRPLPTVAFTGNRLQEGVVVGLSGNF